MPKINTLFDIAANNLQLLRDNSLLLHGDSDFICPICLRPFKKAEIGLLSMEDAPQASLGGKKIAITCKECNNTCGHKSDIHLANYITHIENRDNLPGTIKQVSIIDNGNIVRGKVQVGANRELSMILSDKNNDPRILDTHLAGVKKDAIINVEDRPLNIDWRRMITAIIKNAYIILFARFGYSFLLDPFYNKVRQQILNPDIPILPEALWTKQSKMAISEGIYFSNNNQYRGLFVVYSLNRLTKHNICVCLPTPLFPYEMIDEFFRNYKAGTTLQMFDPNGMDYINSIGNIKCLLKWIYGWQIL